MTADPARHKSSAPAQADLPVGSLRNIPTQGLEPLAGFAPAFINGLPGCALMAPRLSFIQSLNPMSNPALQRESLSMTETLELPPPGTATYADLEALPERYTGELIAGTLYAQAQPASPHQRAASQLSIQIGGAFDAANAGPKGPGGWWILHEPELHFGADVLVPDLVGWRRQRMPVMPKVPWFELVPDWLCEVASPSTYRYDRSIKLERYRQAGVAYVWLVDTEARGIEVLKLSCAAWTLVGHYFGEEPIALEPFAATPIACADLWL